MEAKHILFFLAHQYGHINPSLCTAMELVRRGHSVTYTVCESFAPLIRSIGATPVVLDYIENREQTIPNFFKENDHLSFHSDPQRIAALIEATKRRTDFSVLQLERHYRDRMPDFIVRDDVLDHAGREFSSRYRIPNALLQSQFIHRDLNGEFQGEEMVLTTVPKFFQKIDDDATIPARYKFVGFTPEGRTLGFSRWTPRHGNRPRVLISPTTGLLKQIEFCRRMIEAFRDRSWEVILSISGSRDAFSAIDSSVFQDLPANIHLNQQSANFDILSNVDLYIGQGGQGGALEAIYRGVPQIVVPASAWHYPVGQRVEDLRLGVCIPFSELSPDRLLKQANQLIADPSVRETLMVAQRSMEMNRSAELAADVVEERMCVSKN
jgi:UDP:flavonoid glycosyltransferase YjiC (YdhE family)